MIVFILARDVDRRDTLAGDSEPIRSVLTTDRGVSIAVQGELTNRLHYTPAELVPVRGGQYETLRLRGGYPNATLGGAYGLTVPTVRTDYGTL